MSELKTNVDGERYFYSIDRWAICEALGLSKGKLPQNKEDLLWFNVEIYNHPKHWSRRHVVGTFHVKLLAYKEDRAKTRGHRLLVQCPNCAKWLPFGRFRQHLKITKKNEGKGLQWNCSSSWQSGSST